MNQHPVPAHLHSTYEMLKCAFGQTLDQHQYEGVIRFLYECMSDENLSLVLSFFVPKHPNVIDNDIPKYYKAEGYEDVKAQLDACGYAEWIKEE